MISTLRRNRSISTKVTDGEYQQIVAGAKPKTVSEWARAILVHASEPVDIEFLMLAELMALRTIVLNLEFRPRRGWPGPDDGSDEAPHRPSRCGESEQGPEARR